MAIAASGAIDMDEFHVEAGGTSGDACSLNDADIRGLIDKDAGAAMAMNEWYGASASFYDYGIDQSCRFDAGDDPYLSKTYGSAGSSVDVWTVSWWMKLTNGSAKRRVIFGGGGTFGGGGNTATFISMGGSGVIPSVILQQYNSGTTVNVMATPLLRDESAWYHCVVRFDCTQSTATNRVRIYINGVESPAYTRYDGSTVLYPNQNVDSTLGGATEHYIAKGYADAGEANSEGCFYLADFNYCDGQSLAPSSFGELKSDIWIPKDTSGLTFGDNGFRMQFETSGTLGNDTSGNNNDYASSGVAATDQVPDSPTNNFCTLNPLYYLTASTHLSEGNLQLTHEATAHRANAGTMFSKTGKWYFEVHNKTDTAGQTIALGVGLQDITKNLTYATGADNYIFYCNHNNARTSLNTTASTLSTDGTHAPDAGDIVQVAYDADSGKIFFGVSNTYYAADAGADGNPATGANPSATLSTAIDYIPFVGVYNNEATANFGQDSSFAGAATAQGNADGNGIGDFYYTPPSGFLALCSANLPDPVATIDPNEDGSAQDYFNTVLYSGNSGTQAITGVGFQPDFTWSKVRNASDHHILVDSVRGDKALRSNGTNAEYDTGVSWQFNTDGFTMTGTTGELNYSGRTYATWNWKAGTSFSNDASSTSVGNTDSTGSVSTTSGFSMILWTGVADGSTRNIAHGLGAVPKMIIVKNRERAVNWAVYHEGIGNTKALHLDTSSAAVTDASGWWASTTPTSTVFTTGHGSAYRTGGGNVTEDFIAYCFAEVDGYSKIGSYTGNENNDGAFVYTGFRPAFILIKKVASGDWGIYDNKRLGYNEENAVLYPHGANAEENQSSRRIDLLSNGFKLRTNNVTFNDDSATIYMAFAEQPFKYANAR